VHFQRRHLRHAQARPRVKRKRFAQSEFFAFSTSYRSPILGLYGHSFANGFTTSRARSINICTTGLSV
jgi:hypothetical protein